MKLLSFNVQTSSISLSFLNFDIVICTFEEIFSSSINLKHKSILSVSIFMLSLH